MTVDTFLANFGHLPDAPNVVRKLRELILHLAVQGKLVPQDSRDEPAAKLLERIRKEKAGKVSRRGVWPYAPTNPVNPDEMFYELPQAWEWVRFGDIAQHNAGKTLDKGRNTGQLRDYITTSNLYWGFFDLNNVRQMPIEDDELDRCTAQKGDLLIVEGGEAGRAAVWTKDYEVCFQNHVHRARFYCDIDPFYVYRFFEKLNLSGEIGQYRKGVGISNMSGKALASIVLPLPPLAEQHRIVAKVDQLMALCDELEARQQKQREGRVRLNNAALDALLNAGDPAEFAANWQRICTNFDLLYDHPDTIAKLRAAILQLAVQGKLVPQDPGDEPAEVLLERIKAAKGKLVKAKVIKSEDPLPAIAPGAVPYPIPANWSWNYFQDLTELVTDGEHSTPPRIASSGIPMATAKNVRDGFIDLLATDFVSEETARKCWKRCRPVHDDILMVCVGATTGRLAVIKNPPDFILVRSVALIRTLSGFVVPEYLAIALRGPVGQNQIWGSVKQSAQPCLYIGKIKELNVPLPPLAEQRRIVAKVDQLMALCDALEAKLSQARQQSEKLMEASVRQLLVA